MAVKMHSYWISSLRPVSGFSQMVRYFAQKSDFLDPICGRSKIEEMREAGQLKKYKFMPVRASKTTENASVFRDELINRISNHIMRKGDRELSKDIMTKTFEEIKRLQLSKYHSADPSERTNILLNPWEITHKAVENARPILETTPIKRGGHTYQVPIPVRESRSISMSIEWLIEAGNQKESDKRFYRTFALELIDSANNVGKVIKRKQDLHKLCEANRAYAHYRWG